MSEEGYTYMILRATRLHELHIRAAIEGAPDATLLLEKLDTSSPSQRLLQNAAAATSSSTPTTLMDDAAVLAQEEEAALDLETNSSSTLDDPNDIGSSTANAAPLPVKDDANNDDLDEDDPLSLYKNDFALPGPTVAMYDTVLDAMVCHAEQHATTTQVATPGTALNMFQKILSRHVLDGGDALNANIHTRPTVLSYNAPIRLAAAQHTFIQHAKEHHQHAAATLRRDEALALALGSWDALMQSEMLHRNSATYRYLLHVMGRFFPTSQIKGNMVHGVWHHAVEAGLVDEDVIQAYCAAQTPSNGPQFDAYLERHQLTPTTLKTAVPQRWIRYSRKYRYQDRENTY